MPHTAESGRALYPFYKTISWLQLHILGSYFDLEKEGISFYRKKRGPYPFA